MQAYPLGPEHNEQGPVRRLQRQAYRLQEHLTATSEVIRDRIMAFPAEIEPSLHTDAYRLILSSTFFTTSARPVVETHLSMCRAFSRVLSMQTNKHITSG